ASQSATAPPRRDLAWYRSESRTPALAILALGAATLLIVTVGTLVVLGLNGYTPTRNLILGFKSNEIDGICFLSIGAGLAAVIGGLVIFRRMPTKVSREEAIAGAVLGGQAVVLGLMLLWFSESDAVDKFVTNYFDFERLAPEFGAFVNGAKNTLILAVTSEFFGVILGLILSVFAVSKRAVVRAPARAYINFFRGTPLIWQLVFIGIAIPIGLQINIPTYTAAIIAFSLNTGAYAAEVFRAGIQSIERGQLEAARGLGMSQLQALRYAVIPQAVRRVIPPLMNEFVILVKDTALVLALGLTASGRDLMSVGNFLQNNTFNPTFLIGTMLGYLAICLPSIRLVNILERRLRSGLVGVTA
ncbi:MAG TPA: amino acid ABC transporter permease, partial [Actinomycetota bacterium]|nr:amino acid ABC transporter permease [Actinomycetota bacterium]